MAKPKTRTSFACSVLPKTLTAIAETAKAQSLSQGQVVDKAIALLVHGEIVEPSRRVSKANQQAAEVAAADLTARAVDRNDVAYDKDDLPTQHIVNIPAFKPPEKIDPNNLPATKPLSMTWAQWEMLQRRKNPPAPTRPNPVPLNKPGQRK